MTAAQPVTSRDPSSIRLPPGRLLIGGELRTSGSGGVFTHVNPANGEPQADVPLAGVAEVHEAVAAAKKAFATWRKTPRATRRNLLLRLGALLVEHGQELSVFNTREIGIAQKFAGRGVAATESWFSYYAGWADKIEGQVATANPGERLDYTLPEPYGVIGVIATWNGPLFSMGMKVAPALAAGNTVVIKPAEHNPFVMSLFAQLVVEAGFPPGVVNIVPGNVAAGEALVVHPDVQKLTFTGGPVTARKIMTAAAASLKPAIFELGGKSANLIFADADLDRAINDAVMFSVVIQSGQGCALGTRILVERSAYKDVLARLEARVAQVIVGDPMDPKTDMGPVITSGACDRLTAMIETARKDGSGRILTGGARLGGALAKGFFLPPTVLVDVKPDSAIAQDEAFGPIVTVTPFDSEEEGIAIANSTRYGLAAYIQTTDHNRAYRLADELRAGSVNINGGSGLSPYAPFGGEGLSGFGREGGRAGLDEFLRPKTVAVQNLQARRSPAQAR